MVATLPAIFDPNVSDIHWESLDVAELSPTLIQVLATRQASGLDWTDPSHAEAKAILKEELFRLQSSKCAYCRRDIKDEPGHVEIDHILPKSALGRAPRWTSNSSKDRKCTPGYAGFTFWHLNLALTCKRCNNKKGTYDSRADRAQPTPTVYPTATGSLCWVHPYHDPYSSHIQVRKGFVYQTVGGSPSGNAVIDTCKLAEISALETRAAERKVRRARDASKALIGLASDLVNWTDDQIVILLMERFPYLVDGNIRKAISGLRNVDIEAMSGL